MRLTHPSALVIASQPAEQQPVDRTLTSSDEEACKPDRCLGAVAAATSTTVTHDCGNHAQDRVSVGPHGTIRCTSPVQRIPRQQPQHQQQQPRKAQTGLSACPYHDHETMTISLVGQANMYGSPARAVSPQRSHRHASPTQGRGDAERSSANDAYVRLVDVRPALGRQQQHGKVQFADRSGASQHQQTAPPRCPEPAAAEAAASSSNRRAALAQLRMSRRRQQQLLPADVEQRISEKMCARKKQGHGADWSSRKTQDRRQLFLSDSGEWGLVHTGACNGMTMLLYVAVLSCSHPALTCYIYRSTMQAVALLL